jgi:1,4-dihydroxy-2-naphthoyl-CoA synthase
MYASPFCAPIELNLSDFLDWCASPTVFTEMGVVAEIPILVVNIHDGALVRVDPIIQETLASIPCVMVGKTDSAENLTPSLAALFDIVLSNEETSETSFCVTLGDKASDQILLLARQVRANPVAAISLVLLLRQSVGRRISAGLLAESVTYSMLQGGMEFRRWRAQTQPRAIKDLAEPRVRTQQLGGLLTIEFTRPQRHNAYDAAMRDALNDALIHADRPSCERVVLCGSGMSFCSGGDLDEFGLSPDPASSHLVRIAANPTLRLARVASKLEASVQGACIGSGLEIASFASKVIADESAYFSLPEVAMGLIPGAGGTVSISNRIGRHRTAYLALSGVTLNAKTALEWRLIDAVDR